MTHKTGNKDYSATLQLPKTNFSMRANLLEAEPAHQRRWERLDLYESVLQRSRQRPAYVFHDGPPYANGPIHMGHLLNKILKDLVVRSRLMAGRFVDFVPGWDCHGLPIEHKVLKELGEKGKELPRSEIRRRCREYAERFVHLQAEQLKRLGTLADYDNPYLTMSPDYEAAVLEVFADLVAQGLVYRDLKPVHWSIANRTALADAELEYYERTDPSIYVLFELEDPRRLPASLQLPSGVGAYLMIWTTTPWTLPANLAVAVAPGAEYSLVRFELKGSVRHAIVARELEDAIFAAAQKSFRRIGLCQGVELVEAVLRYRHPFVDRRGAVVSAEYVTLEDGTGLVHTAPGHGAEDYATGVREGLPIYCPVQADGTFDETSPEWLQGRDVWTANPAIVDKLEATGHLFLHEKYHHSYPHDWRSKTPTIFRATEQWFVAVDREFSAEGVTLRQSALREASQRIRFVPDWGRSRLEGMLEARPDWCISRQRAWGLPIPAFFDSQGRVLLTAASVRAVAATVRRKGSDDWFSAAPAELLGDYDPAHDSEAPDWVRKTGRKGLQDLRKGEDIFDVWFESGSSWNGVLKQRGIGYPADLYLEGSDQHRGWFQLSLLPALGATGTSPFKTVLTHGFMVDGEGRKMSKSTGNAIEVEDVLKQHGADVCRWWVSSLSYVNDIKVDWEFFKVASEEYRKVRNTIRFMLGNLHDFDPMEHACELGPDDAYSVDAWAQGQLAKFVRAVDDGYDSFQFKLVSETIFNFCNDAMSAVYLASVKDRLYCDRPDSPRRRRTQSVLYAIAHALIRAVAPILVHTAEEAWMALHGREMDWEESVHFQLLPEAAAVEIPEAWEDVMEFRRKALKALEEARGKNGIKNPLDAGIHITTSKETLEILRPFEAELADLCGVSRFSLTAGPELRIEVQDLRGEPRCQRSWKRDATVKERSDGGVLSDRDAEVAGVAKS